VGSAVVGLASVAGAVSPTWQSRSVAWTTAGPVQATVDGVSCTSATQCVAVGSALLPDSTGATGAFVANLVRSTWVQGVLPLPTGAVDAAMSGVSCPSATTCFAVGSYDVASSGSTVAHGLVETFANGLWTPVVGLDPPGASTAALTAVSCTSRRVCNASGSAQLGPAPGSYAFVSGLAGGAWTAVVPPLPTGVTSDSLASTLTGSSLSSVSYSATSACLAVGKVGTQGTGFAEQLAGTTWTADTSLPSTTARSSVSCVTTSFACTAWGKGPVVESLSTGVWSQATTAGLPYGGSQGIAGTCVSATSCLAFESLGNSAFSGVAVLTGTNGIWTSVDLPGPADAALVQVSCSTATCVGVGTFYDASGQQFTAIVDLVRGRWVQVAYPLPMLYLYFPSVSCVTKTCVVVSGQ